MWLTASSESLRASRQNEHGTDRYLLKGVVDAEDVEAVLDDRDEEDAEKRAQERTLPAEN
jgi:cytidylate kinase